MASVTGDLPLALEQPGSGVGTLSFLGTQCISWNIHVFRTKVFTLVLSRALREPRYEVVLRLPPDWKLMWVRGDADGCFQP